MRVPPFDLYRVDRPEPFTSTCHLLQVVWSQANIECRQMSARSPPAFTHAILVLINLRIALQSLDLLLNAVSDGGPHPGV